MSTASFQNKNVLVTGAAGFIGSHLVDALLATGAQVTGIDNFITGRQQNIAHLLDQPHDNFTFIEADVNDAPQSYLPSTKFEYIFHFASPASPPGYQAQPVETYLVNSLATHQLCQYLLETNPDGQFFFASTSEVYGDPQVHPQPETYWGNVNPNGIRSCYDEAKRLGETICGVHHRDFGLDTRIIRIFNTYGPRIDPNDGRVIPQFIKEALAGQPFSIHGEGQQTRSYCFVSDLVAGILAFASAPNLAGQTINLGNPDEFTIKETAEIISEIIAPERPLEFNFKPMPEDDPTRRRPDITLANNVLQWQPQVSFKDGLQQTIAYFQENEQ